ncbi:MAG: amino acid adenylation domain-containing protein [Candidatus Omnitrophota bacterium]|jgi:amino acid adenylation domain-containing protein
MSYLLHELLREAAVKFGAKTAIKFQKEEISYNKLNSLSDCLAFELSATGVGADSRVGIYIDKSIEAVIAIFGILKTGASYVPLDPMSPASRIKLIIENCNIEHIISSSKKAGPLKQIISKDNILKYIFLTDAENSASSEDNFTGVNTIYGDQIWQAKPQDFKDNKINDSRPAYILYTSGSTGVPKGVVISHKASLAFVNWAKECVQLTPDDNVSSHAPFHFDLSVFDIYATIKAGATLYIVPQGLSVFPSSLADFIEHNNISVWYSVPTILTQLLLYGNLKPRNLSSLRTIIFAGEVFPAKHLRRLMELIPRAVYYNFYGPTETNVCTYHQVGSLPTEESSVPIGKPCDGQKLFLVGDDGKLVKNGEMGELYVDGPTLMDGYWNDPEKTEKVLFKNPFLKDNSKIYKTGDVVHKAPDGNLMYHGRRDNMIKSSGYRIELGEIETILLSYPDIEEAAAVGITDEKIGKRIIAFATTKQNAILDEQAVKLFCSKRLPAYMIPEKISSIKSFPRTSTGKIDRKILEKEDM